MPPENVHGTAVVLGDRGVLITGPSGSGKTTLALTLIDRFGATGRFARLVADDQLFVADHGGRLVARAPASIAGLAEVPGLGPRPAPFEPGAVIDLCVRLVAADTAPRFQENASEHIAGVPVPRIDLGERNVTAALAAVMAWLSL